MARTGDIGLLKVVSESAVASGVRRIEALAGEPARRYLEEQDERLQTVADILKVTPADTAARVTQLLEERKQLERQLAEAKKQLALGGGAAGNDGDDGILEVGSVKLLARVLHGISAKDLRSLIDDGKQKLGSGIAAVVGVGEDGKAAIAVGVTEDLTGTISAVDLVRAGSAALGGKGGGGRADMAQAGGPDGAKADSAIEAIKSELASL